VVNLLAMRISIVMPTRNQAQFIRLAVDSVLRQRGAESELIVQDACSDDRTPEILAAYGDRLQWHRERDSGQVDAIARGFRRASGEVLAWLNSDDAYLPGALAKVGAAFAADPALDFVYGNVLEIDRTGRVLAPNIGTQAPDRDRYLYSHNYICQPSLFIRRRVLEQVGPVRDDLQWFMDFEWIGRFFQQGLRGRRLPDFLAVNREYPETKTNQGGWMRYCELLGIQRRRSGPFLPFRPAVRIYALEWWLKHQALRRSASGRPPGRIEQKGHALLWRLVRPSEEPEIRARFAREFGDRGLTSIEQIWEHAGAITPA